MNHILIDGFNLAYRAHFAFLRLSTSVGMPTGCVYGFMTGLRALKSKYPGHHITITWDKGSNRRKAMDVQYKANRPKFASTDQINDLKEIFKCVNVTQAECAGEEADDVIASLVKSYQNNGSQILILTSDKDLLQLVQDGKVMVIRPKKGKVPETVYDEEAVKKEMGVSPKDFETFLSFRGDDIDNIPGVPRVPSSCLINLIEKHKNIRDIYANLKDEPMTDFQRQTLKSHEERVILNNQLVKLVDTLTPDVVEGVPDEDKLNTYLKKYEFKKLTAKLYIDSFADIPTFAVRTSPALESYTIFDEEE